MNWDRLAKEKSHFFWTMPILNLMMLGSTWLSTMYLVLRSGRTEALLSIPAIVIVFGIMWYVGRKRVWKAEINYGWQSSGEWMEFKRQWDEHRRLTE